MHGTFIFLLGISRNPLIIMEPLVRFELTTYSLRMNCSTPELQRRLVESCKGNQNLPQPASGKSLLEGNAKELSALSLEILYDRGGEARDVVLGCLEGWLHACLAQRIAGHRADAGCGAAFRPI
jgi:hypothetical protein